MKITTALFMLIPLLLCTSCDNSDLSSDDTSVSSESNEAAAYESVTEDTTEEITENITATDDASQSADGIVLVDWEHTKAYTWKAFTRNGRIDNNADWIDDVYDHDIFSDTYTITLAEFPDTEFIWRDGSVFAYENGEESGLVFGSILWNAFFTDLNADGFPELCAFFSVGSGSSCQYIAVYDYHNQTEYTLLDWMEYNYSLYAEDDTLYVRKAPYWLDRGIETTIGKLEIENDTLVMTEEMTEVITVSDVPPADEIVQVDWEHTKVYTWKDFTSHGDDEMPVWVDEDGNALDTEFAFALADFPDTVFVWRHHTISAYENGEKTGLVNGYLIKNAFFSDLNADGFPELCAAVVSTYSAVPDDDIVVYDYHNQTQYLLWLSTVNYALYAEDGVLYCSCEDGTGSTTGKLAIENKALVIKE